MLLYTLLKTSRAPALTHLFVTNLLYIPLFY